ncbi:hypothetical protein VTN77DRAFT_8377 [Rasamsonia byssochlamydoides]|uniref:uncharacterized protein n=1 Tax=Rasamsonia byssochlamydoides TaxID=89139 RepID=UPI003743B1A0
MTSQDSNPPVHEKKTDPSPEKPLSEEEQLAALGHVQELPLSTVVATALTNGGPPCLFYNYVLVDNSIVTFIGTVLIACSLGEIASIYPTAGGQYHWVNCLAPARAKAVSAWFTGWISIGGQLVLTASAAFAAGLQLQGLITLNHLNTYVPQRWKGMLFYWLVLLYSGVVNILGSKILPHSNTAAGVLHVVAFVVIVVILGVMSEKHSSAFVFTESSNTSGWENDSISWLVGVLSTVYPFLGYDAACHLSEELPNPSRNVPLAMVGSVVVNGLTGLVYAIVLLYSLGDLNSLLDSPIGFPFMQLFLKVTNSSAGASILALCISLVAVAANAAGVTSTSRTAWAFARDDALPFSKFFSHVHPTLKVPVRMVVIVVVLQMLLGLLYLGSYTAFNAVLSMAILGMYASYLSPIVFMLLYGRRAHQRAPAGLYPGPFRLGKTLGVTINVFAILWLSLP